MVALPSQLHGRTIVVGDEERDGVRGPHIERWATLMSLGIAMLYLALAGPDRFKNPDTRDDESRGSGRT